MPFKVMIFLFNLTVTTFYISFIAGDGGIADIQTNGPGTGPGSWVSSLYIQPGQLAQAQWVGKEPE